MCLICIALCVVFIYLAGSFGSSGSAVDVRTSNKLFGLIVELLYLAARLARYWTKDCQFISRCYLSLYSIL